MCDITVGSWICLLSLCQAANEREEGKANDKGRKATNVNWLVLKQRNSQRLHVADMSMAKLSSESSDSPLADSATRLLHVPHEACFKAPHLKRGGPK